MTSKEDVRVCSQNIFLVSQLWEARKRKPVEKREKWAGGIQKEKQRGGEVGVGGVIMVKRSSLQ